MKSYTTSIAATILSASLIACGGGGSSTGSSPVGTTLKGTAIDGYIEGAHVYLDINYNKEWDIGEPNFFTDSDGKWSMLIDGRFGGCEDYVPAVIDVPVGAIDSDYGEVTEAYQMIYPPRFSITTDEDLMNTTPLTTVVWDTIQNELYAEGTTLTCAEVKDNAALREQIKTRVQAQEYRVAQRYNVTVDELYGDYIEAGDTELHTKAAALVPSMQASYADTVAVENANPNAIAAFVEYYNSEWDDRSDLVNGWYKETYINLGEASGWSSVTESVSDDLSIINGTVDFYKGTRETVNGVTYEFIREFYDNLERNTCTATEWIEQTTSTAYGVRNTFTSSETTADACDVQDWSTLSNTVAQELTTRVKTDTTNATSQHFFASTTDTGLGSLVMVDINSIDASELDAVNFISTDFLDTTDYSATGWARILMEEGLESEGLNGRTTIHNAQNVWSRTLTYIDGTYTEQCSFDSGSSWVLKTGDNCES